MKKRSIVFLLLLVFATACSNIHKQSYEEIISSVVTSRYDIKNSQRTGYKYYVPNGLSSINSLNYNEVLASNKYNYYLYVDVVSYYNRVIEDYNINTNAYYSAPINLEDKFGYLEINKQSNGKYLVEIMYNYAKIELMVDEQDLKNAVSNSIIVLSSITYNSDVLQSIIGDNALDFNEETYNIFETRKQATNFLEVEEDVYEGFEEPQIEDPDLVG